MFKGSFLRSLVRGAIAFFFSSLLKETKENLKIFRPKTWYIKKNLSVIGPHNALERVL